MPSEPIGEEQKSETERILNLRVQNNVFASKEKESDSQKSDTDNDFNSDSLEIEIQGSQSQSIDMSEEEECKGHDMILGAENPFSSASNLDNCEC